jgi:mono/diheme cytochrome c family protein
VIGPTNNHAKGTEAAHLRSVAALCALCVFVVMVAGACRQDMHDQPRMKAYRGTEFFGDGRSARPLVEGTIARGQLREDAHFFTGKVAGVFAASFPFPVTAEVLARGRERFGIYCTPCHGQLGAGEGMVPQRGYKKPPSYHIDRLRGEKPGYFFDVMTNGFGAMPDYAAQVPVKDRWAIAAYIRVLQLSQHASLDDVPVDQRGRLNQPEGATETPAR